MFPPVSPMIFSDIFLILHHFHKGRSFPRCARCTRRSTREFATGNLGDPPEAQLVYM